MKYEELKKILKEQKLSIKQFSLLANISYGTVKNWSKKGSSFKKRSEVL